METGPSVRDMMKVPQLLHEPGSESVARQHHPRPRWIGDARALHRRAVGHGLTSTRRSSITRSSTAPLRRGDPHEAPQWDLCRTPLLSWRWTISAGRPTSSDHSRPHGLRGWLGLAGSLARCWRTTRASTLARAKRCSVGRSFATSSSRSPGEARTARPSRRRSLPACRST